MKKVLSILLCVVLLVTLGCTALAASDEIQPRWTHIRGIGGGVTDNVLTHTVAGSATAMDFSNTVSIIVTLQKFNSGWTDTSYVWTSSGVGGAGVNNDLLLGTGTYRVKIYVKILSPSGTVLETETVYTTAHSI